MLVIFCQSKLKLRDDRGKSVMLIEIAYCMTWFQLRSKVQLHAQSIKLTVPLNNMGLYILKFKTQTNIVFSSAINYCKDSLSLTSNE